VPCSHLTCKADPYDSTDREMLTNVFLPVAHEDDAQKTARALAPHQPDPVTALHVVEKGEGTPDKTPVKQSEAVAAEAYAAVREVFPDANQHTVYSRDIVAAILEAAAEVEASAIAHCSRGGATSCSFSRVTSRSSLSPERPARDWPSPYRYRVRGLSSLRALRACTPRSRWSHTWNTPRHPARGSCHSSGTRTELRSGPLCPHAAVRVSPS
jgi:hypothetical protein